MIKYLLTYFPNQLRSLQIKEHRYTAMCCIFICNIFYNKSFSEEIRAHYSVANISIHVLGGTVSVFQLIETYPCNAINNNSSTLTFFL